MARSPMSDEAARDTTATRAATELQRRLAEPLAPGLYVVATPIGNLADITLRALATLAAADLICCEDTRHSRTLLSHYAISRPLRALHEHNEADEAGRIVAMIAEGKAVALISDAGTPLVSDPGYRLVKAVIAAGRQVYPVPGPSALIAGLTVSGLPSDTVVFAGFPPPRQAARRTRLLSLLAMPATLILYEAPGRLTELLADLAELAGDREVVMARELTKRFEEVRRGTPASVLAGLAVPVKGEIVVLVAPPQPREVTDDDIAAALAALPEGTSLKDAARAVADRLKVPRTRVYDLGLKARSDDRS